VGHPRAAALDLIAELEPRPRGPFAGLVGIFDGAGSVDTASVTRSMWTTPAGSFAQAGAKVVPASVPAEEYRESVLKTRAVRQTARAASSEEAAPC
jgi:anthranilate/para-aminobenzoate synthase component I